MTTIPPAAQQFVQKYDTGAGDSHREGRVDWREDGIEIDSTKRGRAYRQNPEFVKDLSAAARSFGSPGAFKKWLTEGNPDARDGRKEVIDRSVATAYLYHKYESFFQRWDSGEGMLDFARDARISNAELEAQGGKDAFLAELRQTITDPYDLVLLEHAKFWPSFSDSDTFINEEATRLLEPHMSPSTAPLNAMDEPSARGAGFGRKS